MEAPVRRQSWAAVLVVLVVAAVAAISIRKCGSEEHEHGTEAGNVPAPTAPVQLLAELVVSTPNASWSKLQRGVGGAAGILPTTLPGVLVALTDLDPRLTSELDGTSPMYGVVAGDPADPAMLLAIRLVDIRKARTTLALDAGASERGVAILPARRGASVVSALTDAGWLLVGRRASDLDLGPWLTRPRALTSESIGLDIPKPALAAIVPVITARWKAGKEYLLAQDARMRAERGRAPDFGDPAAIVGVLDGWIERKLEVLGDLDGIHVVLDPTDTALVAVATLPPSKDGPSHAWLERMLVGDAAPVLTLPSTALVALSTRDADPARQDQATGLEDALKTALGARLKDPAPLHEVLAQVTKARSDVASLALDQGGMLLRAPVRDAPAAEKAVHGAIELARTEPFRDALRIARIDAGADAHSAKIVRLTGARDAGAPTDSVLAWTMKDGPVLSLVYDASEHQGTLADDTSLAHFTSTLGSDASSIAVLQPAVLLGARPGTSAPLAGAIGKKNGSGFVRVELSDALVREVVRSQMGF